MLTCNDYHQALKRLAHVSFPLFLLVEKRTNKCFMSLSKDISRREKRYADGANNFPSLHEEIIIDKTFYNTQSKTCRKYAVKNMIVEFVQLTLLTYEPLLSAVRGKLDDNSMSLLKTREPFSGKGTMDSPPHRRTYI